MYFCTDELSREKDTKNKEYETSDYPVYHDGAMCSRSTRADTR